MLDTLITQAPFQIAITLLLIQGVLGGFDTVYHHELTIALPQQRSARLELLIHGIRAVLYGLLFLVIANFALTGLLVYSIAALILIEVGLTLWDFVVEDKTRKLPPLERITHTILAINGGAVFAFYGYFLAQTHMLPTGITLIDLGWKGWILSLFGIGVGVSGVRDLLASLRWKQKPPPQNPFLDIPHQRFLVTGATGFIGSQLVHQLLEAKHQVTILSRNPLNAAYVFQAQVRVITHITKLDTNEVFDCIINLAGERIAGMPWTAKQKQKLLDSRVKLTQGLVDWFANASHKPKVWLQASAIGYYGSRPANEHLDEESTPGQGFASQLCMQWEKTAQGIQQYNTRYVAFRLGLVFGYGGALPQLLLPFRFGFGGCMGSGEQIMSWVHRDDVIGTFAHAIKNSNMAGTYNLVSPEPISQANFAKTVGQWLHRPTFIPIPAAPIRMLAGEMAELFVDGQYVLSTKLEKTGYQFKFPRLIDALHDLD